MSKVETTFVAKCLSGEALADDIDDFVDLWHEGEGDPNASLSEFLGFTEVEYSLWAKKPHLLPFILDARRGGNPVGTTQDHDQSYRLAARDLSPEDAEELTQWLKKIGELPN